MAQGFGLSWACAVCNSPVALTCGGSGPPVGTQLCRHTCDLSRDEGAIHGERLGREHAHAVASPCAPAAGKLPTPTAREPRARCLFGAHLCDGARAAATNRGAPAMSLLVYSTRADRVLQSTTCMYRNFTSIQSISFEQELMPKLPMACDLKPYGWEPK